MKIIQGAKGGRGFGSQRRHCACCCVIVCERTGVVSSFPDYHSNNKTEDNSWEEKDISWLDNSCTISV